MEDTSFDAGQSKSAITPGVLLAALAVISLLVCVGGFGFRQIDVGVGAASVALLAAGATLSWLSADGRRKRDGRRIAH